jgi:hypothetical protein
LGRSDTIGLAQNGLWTWPDTIRTGRGVVGRDSYIITRTACGCGELSYALKKTQKTGCGCEVSKATIKTACGRGLVYGGTGLYKRSEPASAHAGNRPYIKPKP